MFANEIDWLLNPALRAPASSQPLDWQRTGEAVMAAAPRAQISMIRAPRAPGWAAEAWITSAGGQLQRVYIDPTTNRVQATTSFFNVQRFFRDFHMRLMWPDTGPAGYYVVAALSIVLVVQIAAALIFYRGWWTRFTFLRLKRGRPALFTDLHRLMGLWTLLFTPVLIATTVWYLVERLDGNLTHLIQPVWPEAEASTGKNYLPLNQLVARAQAAAPDMRISTIYLPEQPGVPFAVIGQNGAFLVRDAAARVELDAVTGQVISVQRPQVLHPLYYWQEMADRLHFGDWAGLLSRTLYFLFGVMLSVLCLTGAYLHVMRTGMPHTLSRGPAVLTAHGVTLAFLAMSAWGGWNEIRDYGDRTHWPVVAWPVVTFLALWVLSAVAALQWWVRKVK